MRKENERWLLTKKQYMVFVATSWSIFFARVFASKEINTSFSGDKLKRLKFN